MLCIFGTIFISKVFFFVLVAILILGVIGYLVIDRTTDKLTWKLLLRRKYEHKAPRVNNDHAAMKHYETNPTPENLETLQKRLKRE